MELHHINDEAILRFRTAKREIDLTKPVGVIDEAEANLDGSLAQTTTVLLAGKECPFRCLMCDLWQHTIDGPTPNGVITQQLSVALDQIKHRDTIKLYNASNFFDPKAIPLSDWNDILSLLSPFQTVVVENHPNLIGDRTIEFSRRLHGNLQVAMGLESANPKTLKLLNKRMTVDDYAKACRLLAENNIQIRTFLLIQAPGVTADQAQSETLVSLRFALDNGSIVSTLIPTRAGNGIIDHLVQQGHVSLPTLAMIEQIFAKAIEMAKPYQRIVQVDLWDLENFSTCQHCFPNRKERLEKMNWQQSWQPVIHCKYCACQTLSDLA